MPEPVTILAGDCLARLPTLAAESVQTCITSPPYWGLRDYGVAGQLGQEPTLEAYIAHLVEVFRAVRRVLRRDGTLWLNLGDAYSNPDKGGAWDADRTQRVSKNGRGGKFGYAVQTNRGPGTGLGPKQLLMMPARVALALQADGWILRSEIVWEKPNCMPESVNDRPTRSHEMIYLLAQQERYFYDTAAVAEPSHTPAGLSWGQRLELGAGTQKNAGVSWRDDVSIARGGTVGNGVTRNKRSVWTILTEAYPEAHFATFPPALVTPCVLAGTSAAGQCPVCGAPWARVTERTASHGREYVSPARLGGVGPDDTSAGSQQRLHPDHAVQVTTTGWQPTCACAAGAPVAQQVLDPFAGSGTTLAVARAWGRRAVGVELNPAYIALAQARLAVTQPRLLVDGAF